MALRLKQAKKKKMMQEHHAQQQLGSRPPPPRETHHGSLRVGDPPIRSVKKKKTRTRTGQRVSKARGITCVGVLSIDWRASRL